MSPTLSLGALCLGNRTLGAWPCSAPCTSVIV